MRRERRLLVCVFVLATSPAWLAADSSGSATLDRIRDTGRIRLGYRVDSWPFAYRDESGNAQGYAIPLCQEIATAVSRELNKPELIVQWVPMPAEYRFPSLHRGMIDVLCGADTVTLERRRSFSFSIPIYPGGIGALLRADAPAPLRAVLGGRQRFHPTWRAAASQVVPARAVSAVTGTPAEKWLAQRIDELGIVTKPAMVESYAEGIDAVLTRRVDVLFGDRAVLLDAAHRRPSSLIVLDRLFTDEPLALTLGGNDEPFRLLVDATLTRFYRSGELGRLYAQWFGERDASAVAFFNWLGG